MPDKMAYCIQSFSSYIKWGEPEETLESRKSCYPILEILGSCSQI